MRVVTPPRTIAAAELNRHFGRIQDELGDEPLFGTHHGTPRLVMLSTEA